MRDDDQAADEDAAITDAALQEFSPRSRETARVINASPVLSEIADLSRKPADDLVTTQRLLELRLDLADRILLAMLDVSSITAELDCEGERSDQIRDRLEKLEAGQLRRLAFSGILLGAATALLSGGLALAAPNTAGGDIAGIIGGTAQAMVGLSATTVTLSEKLEHPRNLLREVWAGPQRQTLFPRSVWRYLNSRRDDGEDLTNRDTVIAQWRAGERLGEPGSPAEAERIALIFGSGGRYTINDLRARDAILDLLEAQVALLNQDLRLLLREVISRTQPKSRGRAGTR